MGRRWGSKYDSEPEAGPEQENAREFRQAPGISEADSFLEALDGSPPSGARFLLLERGYVRGRSEESSSAGFLAWRTSWSMVPGTQASNLEEPVPGSPGPPTPRFLSPEE